MMNNRKRMRWRAKRLAMYLHMRNGNKYPCDRAGRMIINVRTLEEFHRDWMKQHKKEV